MPDNTRQRILEAAFTEFSERGKAGARVQAIAERAEINKSMLNYYFSSKDELYREVVLAAVNKVHDELHICELAPGETDVESFLIEAVEQQIRFWGRHTDILRLVMNDLLAGGEGMLLAMRQLLSIHGGEDEMCQLIASGKLRCTDERQLHLHLTELTMFFFLQIPVVYALWPKTDGEDLIESRIRAVTDLLRHGLFQRAPQTAV